MISVCVLWWLAYVYCADLCLCTVLIWMCLCTVLICVCVLCWFVSVYCANYCMCAVLSPLVSVCWNVLLCQLNAVLWLRFCHCKTGCHAGHQDLCHTELCHNGSLSNRTLSQWCSVSWIGLSWRWHRSMELTVYGITLYSNSSTLQPIHPGLITLVPASSDDKHFKAY